MTQLSLSVTILYRYGKNIFSGNIRTQTQYAYFVMEVAIMHAHTILSSSLL